MISIQLFAKKPNELYAILCFLLEDIRPRTQNSMFFQHNRTVSPAITVPLWLFSKKSRVLSTHNVCQVYVETHRPYKYGQNSGNPPGLCHRLICRHSLGRGPSEQTQCVLILKTGKNRVPATVKSVISTRWSTSGDNGFMHTATNVSHCQTHIALKSMRQ